MKSSPKPSVRIDQQLFSSNMKSARRQNSAAKPSNGRMGSRSSQRQGVVIVDDHANGNEVFRRDPPSLDDCLTIISNHKAKSSVEEELSSIVEALTMEVKEDYVEKNFATLLYNCLFYIKKGKRSAKESMLALKMIGLLAMIVRCKDDGHEIYRESVPALVELLHSNSDGNKMLACLGIVTFFGSKHNAGETEDSMLFIWKFIESIAMKKQSANGLAAAISVWTFILSGVGVSDLSEKDWQGCVSLLWNILEDDDYVDDVHIVAAAAEALVLIIEINFYGKFSAEAKDKNVDDIKENLREKVVEKLRFQAMREREEDNERILYVLKFLNGKTPGLMIDEELNYFLSWQDRIKMRFLMSFVGKEGFSAHLTLNENFGEIFKKIIAQKSVKLTSDTLVPLEREAIVVRFFQPREKKEDDDNLLPMVTKQARQLKRGVKSHSAQKAKTLLRNKQRVLSAQERWQFPDDCW